MNKLEQNVMSAENRHKMFAQRRRKKLKSASMLTIVVDRASGKAAMLFPSIAANDLAIILELKRMPTSAA